MTVNERRANTMDLCHFTLVAFVAFTITLAGYGYADHHDGATYPLAFMNITPDGAAKEAGFVQLYAVSPNTSVVHIMSIAGGLNEFDSVNSALGIFYNATKRFHELNTTIATHVGERKSELNTNNLGILISASSDLHVYGVKSDKGTTDGFMALPLTAKSNEFFIAGWKCTHGEFFAALQIVTAEQDTCVEIYKVNGDDYTKLLELYLSEQHSVYTFPADLNEDITGFYVNSSNKGIGVLSGHACAFVPDYPNQTFFCDHMVEQIPPVSELGLTHIVPPIIGRLPGAGYIVRAVATDLDTTVKWVTANGATSGTKVLTRGEFVQIVNPLASQTMKVECNKPCLVMLYNTGREAVEGQSDPVPTDPFMMFIAPVERFDNNSGFATPNFCDIRQSVLQIIDFNHVIAIVAKTSDTENIMFDGKPVTEYAVWQQASNWGYSYVAFATSHNAHYITTVRDSGALFGAYVYGHSIISTSSSAYGYTVGYRFKEPPLTKGWDESKKKLEEMQAASLSSECNQERIKSGSAVALHPAAANPQVLQHDIELGRTVNSAPMTDACRERYRLALVADLTELSRLVNEMICNGSMCPYLSGAPGSGVRVNLTSTISNHVLFAAIDTASLTDPVSFDVVASTGAISGIGVKVPYTGITDTTADTFAKCRVEVREYLRQFANWPRSTDLLPRLGGCPAVTFAAPYEFDTRRSVCALAP